LARIYIFPERILDSLSALQAEKKDQDFLRSIKKEYQHFVDDYKANPRAYDNPMELTSLESARWDALRLTLKAQAYTLLERYYIKDQDIPSAVEMSKKCLQVVNSILEKDKKFYIALRFTDDALRDLAYYYETKGELSKLYDLTHDFSLFFDAQVNSEDYVFTLDGAGAANLYRCFAMDKLGNYSGDFLDLLDKAENYFRRIIPYEENLGFSNLRNLYQEIGHCYMLRGKYQMHAGSKEKAAREWAQAFGWFEKSITMDPVYGRDVLKLRNELLEIARHYDIDTTPAEVK